jgi:hypothetical protein
MCEKVASHKSVFEQAVCEKVMCEKAMCEKAMCEKAMCDKAMCDKAMCDKAEFEKTGCEKAVCQKEVCKKKVCENSVCEKTMCDKVGCENVMCENAMSENAVSEKEVCEKVHETQNFMPHQHKSPPQMSHTAQLTHPQLTPEQRPLQSPLKMPQHWQDQKPHLFPEQRPFHTQPYQTTVDQTLQLTSPQLTPEQIPHKTLQLPHFRQDQMVVHTPLHTLLQQPPQNLLETHLQTQQQNSLDTPLQMPIERDENKKENSLGWICVYCGNARLFFQKPSDFKTHLKKEHQIRQAKVQRIMDKLKKVYNENGKVSLTESEQAACWKFVEDEEQRKAQEQWDLAGKLQLLCEMENKKIAEKERIKYGN